MNDINCKMKLFADDTALYIIVENPTIAINTINNDLSKIHVWANKWLVKFNPDKTESLLISRKTIPGTYDPITMDNVNVSNVKSHKHLGVLMSDDGTWKKHIDHILKKVSPRLAVLRNLKNILDRNSLQTIYFAFIRPILEYSDVVWDSLPNYLCQNLENIQIEAARIVTGATKLSSISLLYKDVGWEKLSKRRENHKLLQFHKMYHKKTPFYLSSLIPSKVSDTHRHDTRNSNNLLLINCRTQFYKTSFLNSSVHLWNSFPTDIRENPSVRIFKRFLQKDKVMIPHYFNIGSRNLQILHTRLRLKCSNLKQHLYLRNLEESPFCSCGLVESTHHFLLSCANYNIIRQNTLLQLDITLNEKTLLWGNDTYSKQKNEQIFLTVQT